MPTSTKTIEARKDNGPPEKSAEKPLINEKEKRLDERKIDSKVEKGQKLQKEQAANQTPNSAANSNGRKTSTRKRKYPNPTPRLSISQQALKRLRLVAVAYSDVEREFFPTEEAFHAEQEVEGRAAEVCALLDQLQIPARLYPSDEYFLTNLLVDRPDMVLNLVDTLRGQDALQTSIPGALEMVDVPYTGAGMRGLVIGNDRNLFKQILKANGIPTPDYQLIQRPGTKIKPDLGLPLIVKLNESGGSVGIDNNAVKETYDDAQAQVAELIKTYSLPVIVERFIDGSEITAVVFEDSRKKHVFLGKKRFGVKPDGKHEFTSIESYEDSNSYHYDPVTDEALVRKIETYVTKAFDVLHNKDYAKYDIRVDENTGTPYFTDCNPNTAFGPSMGLPFTEVVETLYGLKFEKILLAMISKYAKKIKTER